MGNERDTGFFRLFFFFTFVDFKPWYLHFFKLMWKGIRIQNEFFSHSKQILIQFLKLQLYILCIEQFPWIGNKKYHKSSSNLKLYCNVSWNKCVIGKSVIPHGTTNAQQNYKSQDCFICMRQSLDCLMR